MGVGRARGRWDESPADTVTTMRPISCSAADAGLVSGSGCAVLDAQAPRGTKQKEKANLSPVTFAAGTPARSETQSMGAQERLAMRNVALDLAARKIAFCEVAGGKVVQRRTTSSLRGLEDLLGPETPPARVAIEACREAWGVHDMLSSWGHEVLMVDTTRVKQLGIGNHGRKNDRIDAEVLARAVERGGIPLAHVLSPARRELRLKLGVRRSLVETQTNLVVTIRGIARAQSDTLPRCDTEYFVERVRNAAIKDETRAVIEPLLQVLAHTQKQLAQVDLELEALCAEEPVIHLLTSAPGVGLIVAAAFVSVIDEAHRFKNAHQVGSYLGLVPLEDSSGGPRRLGSITKKGNSYMRMLAVQAAWTIYRANDTSDPLCRWVHAVAKRRGKRIAVVALARRLVGVLWAMWRDGTVYNPALLARSGARGHERHAQELAMEAESLKRAAEKAKKRVREANKRLASATASMSESEAHSTS